jgi:hypothetical protein
MLCETRLAQGLPEDSEGYMLAREIHLKHLHNECKNKVKSKSFLELGLKIYCENFYSKKYPLTYGKNGKSNESKFV